MKELEDLHIEATAKTPKADLNSETGELTLSGRSVPENAIRVYEPVFKLGVDEKGVERSSGRILVEVNPAMYRPTEAEQFVGDSSKAQRVLGWNPKQTDFPSLVRRMEHADLELAAAARGENQHAFTVLKPFVF